MKVLLLFLCAIGLARAEALFDQGNAAYDAGRFSDAVECYEKLLARDGPRVAVLQNLGSAYHRMDQDGRAILAFERALLLDPHDPDLQANLKLVRDEAAVFSSAPEGTWRKGLERLSRRQWSWLAFGGAILFPLAVLGWVGLRRHRGRGWMIPVGVAGLILVGVSVTAVRSTADIDDRGIIVADEAILRISPFEQAEQKGTLSGGREVWLGEESGGWFWIHADDGAIEGWVAKGEVAPLVPRS